MLAGVYAARQGHEVHIYEKNEKLGKKLFITGKGRCNITNACEIEELFQNVRSNSKFLYSAFYSYHNYDVIDFFEELGLKTKIERGNRVFPLTDHSSDVIAVLTKELHRLGAGIHLKKEVKSIDSSDGSFLGIQLSDGSKIAGDAVFIATGGLSYPTTGSTGDGYRFAEELGHKVEETSPALVPFSVKEPFVKELQGLSLKNVTASIYKEKKEIYQGFGEMLFTHYGVSGPLLLSGSSYAASYLKGGSLILKLDLKPALSKEQLDARILRDFEENKNKQFKNTVKGLYPAKLVPVMIQLSGIHPDKKVNEITREERANLVKVTKELEMTLTGLRDYNEAIITKGGVSVKEVNPSTMESKIVKNVFFIGEVLDLDALTGGFNLQIAWSTAHAAALAV